MKSKTNLTILLKNQKTSNCSRDKNVNLFNKLKVELIKTNE